MDLLLGHDLNAKETWMKYCLGYYEDTPGKFNDMDFHNNKADNPGFGFRHLLYKGGSMVKTVAKMPYPLSQVKTQIFWSLK